jgi:hypothetical protein
MGKRTTVHLTDAQEQALDAVTDETDLSQSEAMRRLINEGLDATDDWSELIPEHVRIGRERERVKEAARLTDWREGFEGRCKKALLARWKNGYTADGLEDKAEDYVAEASVLWPDDEERTREAIQYVEATVEALKDRAEDTAHDPLDVEADLAAFEGVQEAEASEAVEELDEETMEQLVRRAYDRLKNSPATPEMVVDGLSRAFDVPEEAAERAVEKAQEARK